MKKINIIQLVASLCLLLGSIINLLDICIDAPFTFSICSVPFLIASIILYCIYLKKQMKYKNQEENNENQ